MKTEYYEKFEYLYYEPKSNLRFAIERQLNKLGEEGWEVVCLLPPSITTQEVYLLKRKIIGHNYSESSD